MLQTPTVVWNGMIYLIIDGPRQRKENQTSNMAILDRNNMYSTFSNHVSDETEAVIITLRVT